jgi:hypothetical protein
MERLLVVAAYNEEDSIGPVVVDICAVVPDAGVLVVDDGSSDRTSEIALAQGVEVLSLPFNWASGCDASRIPLRRPQPLHPVIQVDTDGQHIPNPDPGRRSC